MLLQPLVKATLLNASPDIVSTSRLVRNRESLIESTPTGFVLALLADAVRPEQRGNIQPNAVDRTGEDASQTSGVRFRSFRCLGAVRLSLGQRPSLETRTSAGGY